MILHLIPHAVLLGCCVVVSALIEDSTLTERPYEVLRKQNLGEAVYLQLLRPIRLLLLKLPGVHTANLQLIINKSEYESKITCFSD